MKTETGKKRLLSDAVLIPAMIVALLIAILVQLHRIEDSLTEWRPVRTEHYHMNYDVAVNPGGILEIHETEEE